ncbi:MAG TPA: peptidylprolyl isomerase [Bacteroidales bacterium]|nr:peptidylprolyl isomerase [Bacteroidales bacterium]
MNPRLPAVFLLFSLFSAISAQDIADRVLMSVDGRDVTAGEFIRMYRKSNIPGNLKDLDSYLDQFVSFKLKVADAIHNGYDTSRAFRTELAGYRNQLARNYLSDPDTREKLLKQAYQRSLVELKCWHILVAVKPEALPSDTLKALKRARDIRQRILSGEPFEQVARSSSDDPSVKINGGNLGYFTAFQIIMPFEDAAYRLRKGELSEPVRTPYGYHIIKVTDRRPSGGKIKVAHIMKTIPPGSSPKAEKDARDTIYAVYSKLLAGASFSDMAARYSDHRESASQGGELNWFGTGEVISDFAEAAFSLKKNGDISAPVKTPYGWHIIRRIDRKPPGTYDEMRPWLESRMNESYLYSISRKSFIEKLKKEYSFRLNNEVVSWFIEHTDTLIIRGTGKYDRSALPKGIVYSFSGEKYSAAELANHIEKRGSMINTTDPAAFINKTIDAIAADQIAAYENARLEIKYPEFRYLMGEFHDGILLFNISGSKVWNKSQDDSTGLRKYYEERKSEFMTKPSAEASLYKLRIRDGMKKLHSSYTRLNTGADRDDKLLQKFNTGKDTLLTVSKGTWEKGQNGLIDETGLVPGVYEASSGGFPVLVVVEKLNPATPEPFSAVRNDLAAPYQEYLEKTWIGQLKEKYSVKIDKIVFEEIRKKLANE